MVQGLISKNKLDTIEGDSMSELDLNAEDKSINSEISDMFLKEVNDQNYAGMFDK